MSLDYDEAYDLHYTDADSRIRREAAALKEFFGREFNIAVNYYSPLLFTSLADRCESATDGGYCTCPGLVCFDTRENVKPPYHHHTNMQANLDALDIPDSSSVRMAYIYHNLCRGKDNQCTDNVYNPTRGLGSKVSRRMIIFNPNDENSETVTVIHEMGHMFGAVDHYGQETNIPEIDDCLYGYHGVNGSDPHEIELCSDCRETIQRNIDIYSN